MTNLVEFSGDLTRWGTGLVLAAAVATLAWRAGSLTVDGAVAAAAIGGIVVGAGGWWLGTLLILFFSVASMRRSSWRWLP